MTSGSSTGNTTRPDTAAVSPNRPGILPWLLLAICLAASVAAWRWAARHGAEQKRIALESRSRQLAREISDSIFHYSLILKGGAALFASSSQVSRTEWADYAAQWQLASANAQVEAISFNPIIPHEQVDAHERLVRIDGQPDYRVSPSGLREAHCPILYIEPFNDLNRSLLGFDLLSDPVRAAMVARARDSGLPATSHRINLLQTKTGASPAGFLLCAPVFRPRQPLTTVSERSNAFAGVVVGAFRVADWMTSLLDHTTADADLHVTLREEAGAPPMFGPTAIDATPEHARTSESSAPVLVPGGEFQLTVHATPSFKGGVDPATEWLVLCTGTALSLLLFGLVQFNFVTRRRATELAVRMTRDLRRAQRELELSTQQLRGLLDAVPDLVFRINAAGTIVDYHPASRGTLDTPPELFLHRNIRQVLPESAAQLVLRAVQESLQAQKLALIEYPVEGPRGTRVIEARFQPISETEAICLARDITARKQTEKALRDNEQRLRTIVETIEEVFWTADPGEANVNYISPAVQRIWGHPPERFLDAPFVLETVHPADRATFQLALQQQAQGLRTSVEYRIFHADGSIRWVWDQGFPVRDAGGRLVAIYGLATNITERKQLEARLRQGQKMEAIGTLAGGIAHDFNNILGSIIGFTELARLDARGRPDIVQNLNDVLKASHRAKGLVRQILAFSRQQEADRSPVDLAPIVEEAARLLRAAAPASIRLDLDLPSSLPLVLADSTQLHQIVMNLGTNAIHAIRPAHGTIRIRLAAVTIDASFAQAHPDLDPGPHIRLSVTDSGTGIEPATLDQIFDPFFTTKPPGEGSGLGLSVVHGIVKSHRGLITVESQPGHGTAFHIYLPTCAALDSSADSSLPTPTLTPTPSAPPAIAERPAAPAAAAKHVLFVDDEPALGLVGRRVLQQGGYRVTVKHNPVEALAAFRQDPDDFDLVITDLTMPQMDGTSLAAQILQLRPDLPVLLTTGFGGDMTVEKARALGLRDLLVKPNDLESLGAAVRRALAPEPIAPPLPAS